MIKSMGYDNREYKYGVRFETPYPEAVRTLVDYLMAKPVIEDVDVLSLEKIIVRRNSGLSNLTVFLIDAYTLGEGKVSEIINLNRDINCIVTISAWNQYTSEAKHLAKENKIGLFSFKEFMGAVYYNGNKFLDYVHPVKDKRK